jgi:hypothetical protein
MSEPAYLKLTPSVARGLRYAAAALDIDARANPITLSDGTAVEITTKAEDLLAAAAWIRYEVGKRDKD